MQACEIFILDEAWHGFAHLYSRFPHGSNAKESACNAEGLGSTPGLGRSPGEGNGNPLQDSGPENPMDGGAWRATVHGVTKSRDTAEPLGSQASHMYLFDLDSCCCYYRPHVTGVTSPR